MPNFMQICLYIIEKILENRKKRPNLGTPPVSICLLQISPHLPFFKILDIYEYNKILIVKVTDTKKSFVFRKMWLSYF